MTTVAHRGDIEAMGRVGSEEDTRGCDMMHTERRGDSPTTRSVTEAATSFGEEMATARRGPSRDDDRNNA